MSEKEVLDMFASMANTTSGIQAITQRGIVLHRTDASQLSAEVYEMTMEGTALMFSTELEDLMKRIPSENLTSLAELIATQDRQREHQRVQAINLKAQQLASRIATEMEQQRRAKEDAAAASAAAVAAEAALKRSQQELAEQEEREIAAKLVEAAASEAADEQAAGALRTAELKAHRAEKAAADKAAASKASGPSKDTDLGARENAEKVTEARTGVDKPKREGA